MKKFLLWYFLFVKRLLLKRSFLILLCIIPIITPLIKSAMNAESGVLRIVMCNEGKSEDVYKIIDTLMKKDSIILFSTCETEEGAKNIVAKHKADAAWIFDEDFEQRIDDFTALKGTEPAIRIIERETTIPLKLSHEVLFGAIYGEVSELTYKNFVYSNLLDKEAVSEDTVRNYFTSLERKNSIIEVEALNSENSNKKSDINYLTVPLRGILSLIIMLCGLTAAIYYLKDNEDGKFDRLSAKKRVFPAFISCFSAVSVASVVVLVTLATSEIWTNILNEVISMFFYVIATTAFCMFFCCAFKSYGKLGAITPGIMISSLVLSPIFFSLKILAPLRLMVPTHYYLYSVNNASYLLYAIIYSACMYGAGILMNYLIKRES